MANRLGELRHEEFSHCCVHESGEKNLGELCYIIFPGKLL